MKTLESRNQLFARAMVAILLSCLGVGSASAQFHEKFDAVKPSWKLSHFDCVGPESTWQQKRTVDLETQNRFEQVFFRSGNGTSILAAHDIPPSFVIPELNASVRVKANRPGIKFLARVVLPHTESPDGKGPMKTTLIGATYQDTNRWQVLDFQGENLAEKLKQDIWVLRRKYGTHVTLKNAFVDKIILNLYTGTGESNVQIDDIKIGGVVSADQLVDKTKFGVVRKTAQRLQPILSNEPAKKLADAPSAPIIDFQVQQANHQSDVNDRQPSLVQRDGSVIEVRGSPFFPRIVQHNGESFEFLKTLGFNTVELKTTATEDQLESAESNDMWIVCPAPPSAGLSPIEFEYDRVLAWSVGQDLTAKDLKNVQQLVREIRQSDMREGRPIVSAPNSHWNLFGYETDVLAIGLEPLGTSFLASQYSSWLRLRRDSAGSDTPVWATIQTEFSPRLAGQVATIAEQLPPTPIEPQQLKFLCYEALAGGSRGLRFVSRTPLDSADPSTRLRAKSIQWATAHMKQLEPWAVGGALMGEIPIKDHHLDVTAFNTNRSRLLLIQRPTHHEQYWAGDTALETIQFKDTESTFTNRAMQIGEQGLIPLSNSRNHSGNLVRIDECPYTAAVVFSQDPMVVNALNQTYETVGQESMLQLHLDITRQWAAILQLINTQMGRMGRSSAAASGSLNEAINNIRKASELIGGNSPAMSVPFLDRADERLAFARREMVTQPLGLFKSKTSTPFLTHCSLVPLHWQLSERLKKSTWNPNGLAGGDFEDLGHMTRNGWQNNRLPAPLLKTNVELSEAASVDGRFGLKMSVEPLGSLPSVIQARPVWIKSAPVSVKQGQLVRIHGWVNVPKVILGSQDGLLITDSIGGEPMAERVPITKGWQEFALYRAAEADGTIDVTFTLTGVGTAMLDEITVRSIDLPPLQRQAKRQAESSNN